MTTAPFTPADEIRQAADKLQKLIEHTSRAPWWGDDLDEVQSATGQIAHTIGGDGKSPHRNSRYIAAMHPGVGAALAKHLRDVEALHTPTTCQHEGCMPHGCDWCGDEDWPCADVRNALAIARAINGTNQ